MPDLYFTSHLISVGLWEKDTRQYKQPQDVYDLRSIYVETFWLPILGPSAILFLRFLARRFSTTRAKLSLDLKETARCIGLSDRIAPNAPIIRTITRCMDFSVARIGGSDELLVRNSLPLLSQRHQNHLPVSLLELHMALNTGTRHRANSTFISGQKTALRLLKTGLNETECEKYLLREGFHPSLVNDVVSKAKGQLQNLQLVTN